MLLSDKTVAGIRAGEITVLFRRWRRPAAKAGGTQMTQGGVVAIDSVDVLTEARITAVDAQEAGFASRGELFSHLIYRDHPIYRIRVHWAGEDPRIALRADDKISATK